MRLTMTMELGLNFPQTESYSELLPWMVVLKFHTLGAWGVGCRSQVNLHAKEKHAVTLSILDKLISHSFICNFYEKKDLK